MLAPSKNPDDYLPARNGERRPPPFGVPHRYRVPAHLGGAVLAVLIELALGVRWGDTGFLAIALTGAWAGTFAAWLWWRPRRPPS
jgi:hypothetical protein